MNKIKKNTEFHGGCVGCTQQTTTQSYQTCKGCQYFDVDWSLPDKNNSVMEDVDWLRVQIKLRIVS